MTSYVTLMYISSHMNTLHKQQIMISIELCFTALLNIYSIDTCIQKHQCEIFIFLTQVLNITVWF